MFNFNFNFKIGVKVKLESLFVEVKLKLKLKLIPKSDSTSVDNTSSFVLGKSIEVLIVKGDV